MKASLRCALLAALTLFVSLPASAISWPDGPTLTVPYTVGQDIGVLFIATDTPYVSGQTIEIVSGSFPAGVGFAGYGGCQSPLVLCTAFLGTPSAYGDHTTLLRASDGDGRSADLTVVWQPNFSLSGTLPSGVVGVAYSASLAVSGGAAPVTWSISSGSLPAGLSIDSSTGEISGTPSASGVTGFTVQAVDSESTTATSSQSVTIHAELTVTTTSLPETTVGAAYSQTLVSGGGTAPKTWSIVSGGLPSGLSLNASTGEISGTAAAAGAASFTAQVECCSGATAQQALEIIVNAAPSVTTSALPSGAVSTPYEQTLTATGGTGAIAWSISAGSLPAGLSLDGASGVISGTPSAVETASFTVQATDSLGVSGTQALAIEVVDHPEITTLLLDPLTVGQNVSAALQAVHGEAPYAWSLESGALPDGMALNPSTGALTGVPTTSGEASFTAKVTDANDLSDTQALTWTVNPAPEITTSSLPETTAGRPLPTTAVESTGGLAPLSWSATGVPSGLSLSAEGVLSGTPMAAGVSNLALKVTDSNGVEGLRELAVTVNSPPQVTTSSLPRGTVGANYSQALSATGGTGELSFSVIAGALPAGVSLTAGSLTGAPTTVEVAAFTVQVEDEAGATATAALSIETVDPLLITTTSLAEITVAQDVDVTIGQTGGFGPYTWSLSGGGLPAGITLEPSTGRLSGVAAGAGSATFSVQVTDVDGRAATQSLSWLVNPGLQITTSALPPATANHSYSTTLTATGGTGALQWSAAGLPAGVVLSLGTGVVSGDFPNGGKFAVEITVTDANGVSKTAELAVEVSSPLQVLTRSLPMFTAGSFKTVSLEASGGLAPLSWSGNVPAGLQVRPDGKLTGSASSTGTFAATLRVHDANGAFAERQVQLVVEEGDGFSASPLSLHFESAQGQSATPPQQITVSSSPANQSFSAMPNVSWLQVSVDSAETPAVLTATALPAGLEPGDYTGHISLVGTGLTVNVGLTIEGALEPSLRVEPSEATVSTHSGAGIQSRLFAVWTTGDPGPATIEPDPGAPWLSVSLAPAAGPALAALHIDPSGLAEGSHEATVVVSAGDLNAAIPVLVTVASVDFSLSHHGLTFDVTQGAGGPASQMLRILNGAPGGLDWQAVEEGSWLHVTPASGSASPTSEMEVNVDASGLEPGVYAAPLRVESIDGSAWREADIRLRVAAGFSPPEIAPAGLVFVTEPGVDPAPRTATLTNASMDDTAFVRAVSPSGAASWLLAAPGSGSAPAGGAFDLTVQPMVAGLSPGTHRAALTVELADGTVRMVGVTVIVREAACEPSALTLTFSKLGDHFRVRADSPWAVELVVTDDCGNPISQGAGLLRFSDPLEPALPLRPGPNGLWTTTWTPTAGRPGISITAEVESAAQALTGALGATGVVEPPPPPVE